MICLKQVREGLNVSAEELAIKTKLAKQTIWAYERGDRNPDPETLCLLSDALDVSLDMLVRGKEKDRPEERSVSGLSKRLEAYSLPELEEIQALANYLIFRKRREQSQGQASVNTK